ncbi:MAG: L-fucose/L-arabinose isomerase family protein [Actinobacteria bacterium]|nr:L-fucose/L-arabinose isomerase family protein [Actinomycetota bacterium]
MAFVLKPKIGVMAIANGAYFPQFPDLKEKLTKQTDILLAKFSNEYDVVYVGMVDSETASLKAAEIFRAQDVDIVFCHCTTYSTSSNLLPAVKDLDVSVVLLNIQHVTTLDTEKATHIEDWLADGFSCGCVPEMVSVLRRAGKRYSVITGYLEGDDVVDKEIDKWCKAATVRRKLRGTSLGLIGRPYPGMLDLYIDETKLFLSLGVYTEMLELSDIIKASKGISNDRITAQTEKIMATFEIFEGIDANNLAELAGYVCGLENLAQEKNISAFASHYGDAQGEEGKLISVLNPACSMLIGQGIAWAVEGDMKVALAMSILRTISGTGTLAELYSLDFDNDICIIGHSGSGDPAISYRKPLMKITKVFHGKSGGGYLTQFYPKFGGVTLLALTQDETGGYRMIAAEGINNEGPILQLGDTNCRVAFSIGLRNFVNEWCLTGPTHHFALGSGLQIDTIKYVSNILNIPLEIVCR